MTERQITFIDVDENPLVVWLKDDRVQFFAVDSEPELEAAELHELARALFATYVAAPLARRLASAHIKIDRVREQLAATGADEELIAALDGALVVVDNVRDAITATRPGVAVAIDPDDEYALEADVIPAVALSSAGRKPTRRKRLGERPGKIGWGWAPEDGTGDGAGAAGRAAAREVTSWPCRPR
ncbi:MAG TPA: hypothetical protein VFK02_33395 [Kofleriaceae bacterium]|nr:hypothetical protein [Kofleriaceae bacterium]